MTDVVEIVARTESAEEAHLARLLILLGAFTSREDAKPLAGLTKLAKLDFLLRYPTYLQRALRARNKSTKGVMLQDHERTSVESEMVRYRFGPWDHRYRRWLSVLLAKGLIEMTADGRGYFIKLTPIGNRVARQLAGTQEFEDIGRRAKVLKTHFDLQGTTLMQFIYKTFPDVVTLRPNEPISP